MSEFPFWYSVIFIFIFVCFRKKSKDAKGLSHLVTSATLVYELRYCGRCGLGERQRRDLQRELVEVVMLLPKQDRISILGM